MALLQSPGSIICFPSRPRVVQKMRSLALYRVMKEEEEIDFFFLLSWFNFLFYFFISGSNRKFLVESWLVRLADRKKNVRSA